MELKDCYVEVLSPYRGLAETALQNGGTLKGDQLLDAMDKEIKRSKKRHRQLKKKLRNRRILTIKRLAGISVIKSRHVRAVSLLKMEQAKKIASLNDKNDDLRIKLHYVNAELKREKCRQAFMEKQKARAKLQVEARSAAALPTTTVGDLSYDSDVQIITEEKPARQKQRNKPKNDGSSFEKTVQERSGKRACRRRW